MMHDDEEVDVDGCFISNNDLETMKAKLKKTRNMI